MTPEEFLTKWQARLDLFTESGALVDGAKFCEKVLVEMRAVLDNTQTRTITPAEGARLSGYSAEHLGRLVRDKTIPNAGRPNAPRVRLSDLPIKPGHLPTPEGSDDLTTTSKRQVALSIVGHDEESAR